MFDLINEVFNNGPVDRKLVNLEIDLFCNQLKLISNTYPELRIGQIIVAVLGDTPPEEFSSILFNSSNAKLNDALQVFINDELSAR